MIFLVVKVIPIILLTAIAWNQILLLGSLMRDIAVDDSAKALNDGAIENIERMTTDLAASVAEFLYQRDDDIRVLAGIAPSDAAYRAFSDAKSLFSRHFFAPSLLAASNMIITFSGGTSS